MWPVARARSPAMGKSPVPRAEGNHHAQAKIDDRHGRNVRREMILDIVGDADEAELGVAAAEERYHVPAKIYLRGEKEDQRHEEEADLSYCRCDESKDRSDDG